MIDVYALAVTLITNCDPIWSHDHSDISSVVPIVFPAALKLVPFLALVADDTAIVNNDDIPPPDYFRPVAIAVQIIRIYFPRYWKISRCALTGAVVAVQKIITIPPTCGAGIGAIVQICYLFITA